MSGRKSIATVVILAAGLLTGEVQADCLDGHLENFRISGNYLLNTALCDNKTGLGGPSFAKAKRGVTMIDDVMSQPERQCL